MKLKPEQLAQHFSTQLLPAYWISGDEPLLMQEAGDCIRQKISALGYEREVIQADAQFDGRILEDVANNLSLFSELKLIELRLTINKLNETQSKKLQQYLSNPPSHCVLMITSPKLVSQASQSTWFRLLDKVGAIITLWPIDAAHLPGWIQQRMKQKGLVVDFGGAQFLAQALEGNLLAIIQTIEKIALTSAHQKNIGLNEIEQQISSDAKFDIFKLVDMSLIGNFPKAYRILKNLEAEGIEPTLLLWAFTRELRSLAQMLERKNQGVLTQDLLTEFRVFTNRKVIIQQALQRLSLERIHRAIQCAAQIDLCIKGVKQESTWELFPQLIALN